MSHFWRMRFLFWIMVLLEQVFTREYVNWEDSWGYRSNASPCCPVSIHILTSLSCYDKFSISDHRSFFFFFLFPSVSVFLTSWNLTWLYFRDLSENELVGPIPRILGNLSYTGKLLVWNISTLWVLEASILPFIILLAFQYVISGISTVTNLLVLFRLNWGIWQS